MAKVLRNLGLADGRDGPAMGQYLKAYDPEAFDGMGAFMWTRDVKEAMKFDDAAAAFRVWTQVPNSRPRRPDGRPNKPLTAFSISIEEA